ncbi:hypothetical protein GIB67_042126 [Kingdonia uniflora]|uniref:peptidylprolyl isomerase n=1 Tax=Kingdonia uniflora TaxID=39325 RepID=A0A7J7NNR2_9MAGN|nr:hypothetical protein GIB67_042126 [Kingdonia uniflora]
MAFWGVEIKSGKPFTHSLVHSRGRLHISQASLGIEGSSTKKTSVQINVGDKSPIILCHFIPSGKESCSLNIELEEAEDVVFSVLGPRSVNLIGYYLGNGQEFNHDGSDTESYGEDIDESESGSDYAEDEFSDEYEEDFIDDDGIEMFPDSPRRNSGVVIEEILDDGDQPAKANGGSKRLKKKYQISDSADDDDEEILDNDDQPAKGNSGSKRLKKKYQISDSDDDDRKIVVKGHTSVPVEDEDGFPVSSLSKNKRVKDEGDQVKGLKRKMDIIQDDRTERGVAQPKDSLTQSSDAGHENDEKPKKKKKKNKGKTSEKLDDNNNTNTIGEEKIESDNAKADNAAQDQLVGDEADYVLLSANKSVKKPTADAVSDKDNSDVKKKKKNKKNKKSKTEEDSTDANTDEIKQKEAVVATEAKKSEVKPQQVREFSNGLIIEEIEMGKPDGQKASPGKKISVKYIGKLKKTGKIFDSSVGGPPFKFRLGVGEVISGWDVGVNGMRVGDKRRLTIPPSMAYKETGAGKIPPNAWLVFDVELVSVH